MERTGPPHMGVSRHRTRATPQVLRDGVLTQLASVSGRLLGLPPRPVDWTPGGTQEIGKKVAGSSDGMRPIMKAQSQEPMLRQGGFLETAEELILDI